MSGLSQDQRAALEQLQQITAGEDEEREIAVLRSVNWNVEKAAQAYFDAPGDAAPQRSAASTASTSRTVEQMSIDDSAPAPSSSASVSRRPAAPAYPGGRRTPAPWTLYSMLSFPFSLISGLLGFIFRLIRYPFTGGSGPGLRPGSGNRGIGGLGLGSGGNRGIAEDPTIAAERFVQELEDELGAHTVSHAAASYAGDEKKRDGSNGKTPDRSKILPDFFLGSYEQALKTAEKDLKVLCVIIISSEHDDTPEFKRAVMTDPDFVKALTDNDMLVYGGDIRSRDAYQASLKLGATTYPFVAFIALHPTPSSRSSSSSSSSKPKLTVLSRHEGSPSSRTSASTLATQITRTIIPRTNPLLGRLRTERWEREQERRLRAEQDAAFEETARKDRERILKRQEEERKAREEEAARIRKVEEDRRAKENRVLWRTYVRRNLVGSEPGKGEEALRIGFRTPDGKRAIRSFGADQSTLDIYLFVETLLISSSSSPDADPSSCPVGLPSTKAAVAQADFDWAFGLVTAYPRKEIRPSGELKLRDVPELKGGANLVLEMKGSFSGDEEAASDEDEEEEEEEEDDE